MTDEQVHELVEGDVVRFKSASVDRSVLATGVVRGSATIYGGTPAVVVYVSEVGELRVIDPGLLEWTGERRSR